MGMGMGMAMACCCLLAGCDSGGVAPSASAAPTGARSVPVHLVSPPGLGGTVAVPDGWQADMYQHAAVLGASPPGFVAHGPSFSYEKLALPPPAAVRTTSCRLLPGTGIDGPLMIEGHPGAFQYMCDPRSLIGDEWTVVLPTDGGAHAWRVTYLGYAPPGGGVGDLTGTFRSVTAAMPS